MDVDKSAGYIFAFWFGMTAYSVLEICFRGYTHWTMMLTGGLAMTMVFRIYTTAKPAGRLVRCLAGCVCITVLEYAVGTLVNCRLGMHVWDYSSLPYHWNGQVCPLFTALWFALCIPADFFCAWINEAVSYSQRSPGYRLRSPAQSFPDASASAKFCIPPGWKRIRIRSVRTDTPRSV